LKKPERLMVCAECGVQVGTGHVMRCLAVGQAWKRAGGDVIFLLPEGLAGIEERVRAEGLLLETLPEESGTSPDGFVRAALRGSPGIVVLDGYSFGAPEQALLSAAGVRVLTVDDYGHASDYPVRWVLNQNPYAAPEMYPRTDRDTRLLLGAEYALLRDEFLPWAGWKRTIPERAHNVLITIGGSDPENLSERILRSLELLPPGDLEVVLVVGGGNPHGDALRAAAVRCPVPVRLERSVRDMPSLMAWADVAISGAGGTSYELCYMGLPSLLLVVAENQRQSAERLSDLGIAVNAGTAQEFRAELFAAQLQSLIESSERRAAMNRRGRELVDGLGSERVCGALLDRELKLRLVREGDRQLLFEWADDPAARAASFHSATFSWEGHVRWFSERLRDSGSVIYIGENAAGKPLGLVRFHIKGEIAVLSVNVAPEVRGIGWGRRLIAFATHALVRAHSVQRIDAFVKLGNDASVRLFDAIGYRRVGIKQVAGQEALLFSQECGNRTHVDEHRSRCRMSEGREPRRVVDTHVEKIAIAQPTYLPWLGYFDLLDQVDKFVLLDTVQFSKQSWQQRNRIKTPTGLQWLTVPVVFRGRLGQRIVDAEIREPEFWRDHLRTIELNYRRAPFFDLYYPALSELLRAGSSGLRLAELTITLFRWLSEVLGIKTPIVRSSELAAEGKRTQLLAEICSLSGATTYVSPLGSADYLLHEMPILTGRGVTVVFQHYEHPLYHQLFPPFQAHASVLDLLFNEGENSLATIRSGRRPPFTPSEVELQQNSAHGSSSPPDGSTVPL
jgi:UDP-2,4-diacetamido-2,4,6-trideoxy-beta-L-altropyranose hydrolase